MWRQAKDRARPACSSLRITATLYLDEVADMPLETQGKILRVAGGPDLHAHRRPTRVQVDARVICSTTTDLRTEIAAGTFREDLYHRLNVVPVRVPALAERREDIPMLVAHFMKRLSATSGLAMRDVGDDAMAVLQAHTGPGNVRQLRNIVERLLILASDDAAQAISPPIYCRPISAPMRPGDRAGAISLSRFPCARRGRSSSATIWWRRSTVSAATSRAPRPSSAWSGRRCNRKLKSLGVGPTGREQGFKTREPWLETARAGRTHCLCRWAAMCRMVQPACMSEDRGLQLGDAVYEVCLVLNGCLMDESEHLDRLERSLREIQAAMPMPARAAEPGDARGRAPATACATDCFISRSRAARSGAIIRSPPQQPRPTLILTARGMDMAGLRKRRDDGIAAITQPDERWARRDIKTTQLLALPAGQDRSAQSGRLRSAAGGRRRLHHPRAVR